MTKVAVMLYRSIVGCGETKYAAEIKEALGDNCTIFANTYKKWPRRNAHSFNWKSMDEFNDVDFDQIWCISLPAINFDSDNIDECIKQYESSKCKKVLFQLDHSIHSLLRNAKLKEFSEASDCIFMHSLNGDFAKWLDKNNIINQPRHLLANPFSFDKHRKLYWKDINQQCSHRAHFIGRAAVWKGIEDAYSIHKDILKNAGFITTLEGMELSIGSLGFWFNDGIRKHGLRNDIEFMLAKNDDDIANANLEQFKNPYIFGAYVNSEALERLSKCAFSLHFTHLAPKKYGTITEYTLLENIACGTVPIVAKHYLDNAISFITEKCHPPTSALIYDSNFSNTEKGNLENSIIELMNDSNARDIYRNDIFDYWRSQNNNDIIINKLFEKIN